MTTLPVDVLDVPDVMESLGIRSIWAVSPAETQQGCLVLEILGGPKSYARVWWKPSLPAGSVEWGWVLPAGAVCLWSVGQGNNL